MPKNSLEGLTTSSGWYIKQQIVTPLGSGGNFCSRYIVESPDGKEGFLKAMDLSSAQNDLKRMHALISEYLFEQGILERCKNKRMTRVVTPLDVGQIESKHFPPPANIVYYVIFDMANGDLRTSHLESPEKRWLPALRALHNATVGVNQLHKAEISHQDIKPSNVLSFSDILHKISDLGRVVDKAGQSPFSEHSFPGDQGYKPIEMFYGIPASNFIDRLSCDMFMLGSLAFQIIEGVQLNVRVLGEAKAINPGVRQLTYSEALPVILTSFNVVLDKFEEECRAHLGTKASSLLASAVREMCHPDPNLRGNRRHTNTVMRLSLDRYISKFNLISFTAKIEGVT